MPVLNLRLGLQFVVDAAGSGWVCRISVEDEKKTFSAFFKARTLAPTTNYLVSISSTFMRAFFVQNFGAKAKT
jgi:hypothetical protein